MKEIKKKIVDMYNTNKTIFSVSVFSFLVLGLLFLVPFSKNKNEIAMETSKHLDTTEVTKENTTEAVESTTEATKESTTAVAENETKTTADKIVQKEQGKETKEKNTEREINNAPSKSEENYVAQNETYNNTNNVQNQTEVQTQQQPTYQPEPTQVVTQAPAPVRLTGLGNTGLEFNTLAEAGAWLQQKIDESGALAEAGKQDWVYSGNYFEIPWSDGHTTASVNLYKN